MINKELMATANRAVARHRYAETETFEADHSDVANVRASSSSSSANATAMGESERSNSAASATDVDVSESVAVFGKAVQGMGAADVTAVATQAMKEAHGNMFEFGDQPMKYLLDIGYPVPKWMSHEECEAIVRACVAVEVAEPVAEPVPVRSRL